MNWSGIILLIVILILIGINEYVEYRQSKSVKPKTTIYLFRYYISNNDPKVLPMEFLVDWKISALENHLYILEKTLEEEDIYGYLQYVWQGYYGKEVYLDVHEKNIIKGSGPYYDLLFRFKVEGGKVWLRRKE